MSMNQKIYKVFSGVVFFVLLSKALGFVREALIAARYGAGFISDVYVLEDGLINTLYTIWAGVISTTFIPMSLSFKEKDRNRFSNNYLNIFLIIILFTTILSLFFTREILYILVPGFFEKYNLEQLNELIWITRINLGSLLFVYLENFLIVVLQSKKFFIFSSIQGIILNCSLIIYLCFFYEYNALGIVLTNLIGHLLSFISLFGFIKKKKIFKYNFYLDWKAPYLKNIILLSAPVVILNVISQFNYLVDRSMASLLNSGSMSLLNYANIISNLIYSVFGVSIASMAYTDLSIVQNNAEEFDNTFKKYIKITIYILSPIVITMIMERKEIINIIYNRGNLEYKDISVIANLLLLYIPSNCAMAIRDMYNRLLYIKKKTIVPSVISGISLILNITLNVLLTRLIGVLGLALATSISSVLATIFTIIYVRKKNYISRNNYIDRNIIVFSSVSIIFCFIINKVLFQDNTIIFILKIIVTGMISLIIFNHKEISQMIKERGRA